MVKRQQLSLCGDGEAGRYRAGLPQGSAGNWCRLTLRARARDLAWIKLDVEDPIRGHVVRETFLGSKSVVPGGLSRSTLLHLPPASSSIVLHLFGGDAYPGDDSAEPDRLRAELQVMSRRHAAMTLVRHHWRAIPRAVAGHPSGLLGRLRAVLGRGPARAGQVPPYAVWRKLYGDPTPAAREKLLATVSSAPAIDVLVVGRDPGARSATLACLSDQWLAPARSIVITPSARWTPGQAAWVLVMQAGETLAPHALACFALALGRWPRGRGFYADADCIGREAAGPADPLFKPQADPWMIASGLLTRGACLFQAADLSPELLLLEADDMRRALAERLPSDKFLRIPLVLTHVPSLKPGARARAHAGVEGRHATVSVIVPTSAMSNHVLRCLRKIVERTDYPSFELVVAVSGVDTDNRVQSANLRRAAQLPRVRILDLGMAEFNYAAVNNAAVRRAGGELILLMNDDVVPINPSWLLRLVAFLADEAPGRADIVGPRLLYGNGQVQHGGVIMGLANLCEHAFRLTWHSDPGPHGIASLDRQVSAVTGACMLLSRSLYETLGGMDESFAVALNDVDFCLRAGKAERRIVYAAGVELTHYESLSLGRHYAGARSSLEGLEVRQLRARWAGVIAADPFYNPSASLQPGREFQPAFPPRITSSSWILD